MQQTPLSDVAVFRTRPTDHVHATTIAAALQRLGQSPTQTNVLRFALKVAGETLAGKVEVRP